MEPVGSSLGDPYLAIEEAVERPARKFSADLAAMGQFVQDRRCLGPQQRWRYEILTEGVPRPISDSVERELNCETRVNDEQAQCPSRER